MSHTAVKSCLKLIPEAKNRHASAEQVPEDKVAASSDQGHVKSLQSHALADEANQARIVIVGAGIAGLNAALTLQDAGLSCSIYEVSNRIGGRMHSDTTTWADGMVSELCGEFIDSDHETIHQLIKRFGLKTVDLGRARADRGQSILYFSNRYY